MTIVSTPPPPSNAVFHTAEIPVAKPPPLMTVGVFAWLRANLFKSTFDTILTIVAGVISIAVIVSLISWIVGAANWFVVTQNIEQIMVGTFPRDQLWRVNAAALACAFVIGFTIYAYTRLNRFSLILVGVSVIVMIVAPPIIMMVAPPASTYLAAGDADGSIQIAAGTENQTPQSRIGFIGRADEEITVQLASFETEIDEQTAQSDSIQRLLPPTDEQIVAIAGFTDRAASAVVNAASERLSTIARIAEIDSRLAGDRLTANQRANLTETRASLEVPSSVTEHYEVNRNVVTVTVQQVNADGQLGDIVRSGTLTDDALNPFVVTLPADGWYVLQKSVENGGVAILRTTGIYPVLERNLSSGIQYARITDRFETAALRPRIDGAVAPVLVITDAQYRGIKPLSDYLRLYAAPFLNQLRVFLLPALALGILGYVGGMGVSVLGRGSLQYQTNRADGGRIDPRRPAQAFTLWLWILYLFVLALLVYGVNRLDAFGVALLIGRFVWVGWAYYAGANLKSGWGRQALGAVFALGLVQAVLAERIDLSTDLARLIPQFIGVLIWMGVGVFAAMRGAGQRDRIGSREVTRGFIVAGVLWFVFIIASFLLLRATDQTENLLPVINTQRWGGLLLTMLLTIVSIVASFPIGVLLALGRRSHLPVVKGTCVAFIELVRGVPLITVLFMAQLLVPLVNPALAEVENVFRAMVGLSLFSAAYLAENVRGGLQSVSGGQEEAARALGLQGWQITLFIVLPQALRAVIPALVGQFISLFKDTSLVALVGLLDLTGIARSTIAQSEFVGLQSEVFFFTSVIYFVFSSIMASVSRRIEFSGSGATRRTL